MKLARALLGMGHPGPPTREPRKLARALIGMVHLGPLPGSPRWDGSMERVVEAALADATALVGGGMDALLVENFGDAPFSPGRVEPATVAAMTAVAAELRRALPQAPLGVNVLKNDARAALAVAAAVGARFIRVNVHAGAVLSDQGVIQSDAYATLRDRRLLGADVRIFADAGGNTAVPAPELGQLLLVGFQGTALDAPVDRLLCEVRVGGVVLFARNIVDPAQLAGLTRALRERAAARTGGRP